MVVVMKSTILMLFWGFLGGAQGRPNIIIMQPDDLQFLDEWTPPPYAPSPNPGPLTSSNHNPAGPNPSPDNDGKGLQHINSLRLNGVQMMQAYTTSPLCGTSRYSTITGKMPSRAASVRNKGDYDVHIDTTKLQDIDEQKDCSKENLAVAFRNEDYRTGMFGKWHLSSIPEDEYTYEKAVDIVKGCGFTTVGGLYVDNLWYYDGIRGKPNNEGAFSHNMEWVTHEAIKFIEETTSEGDEFFMYFNPTVPHMSGDVNVAINKFDCKDTPDPNYDPDSDPWIKGMSENAGCRAYRDSVVQRAENTADLGKIWLDDAVGELLKALEDANVLNDTIFLFQSDNGMDTKGDMYEGGIRIPQFVQYPNGIEALTKFDGLVSTVDIGATMMDFAGINPPYDFDGKSWKNAIKYPSEEDYWKEKRCLFFEPSFMFNQKDSAVRCGCYKYLSLPNSNSRRRGGIYGLSNNDDNLFDLCGGTKDYITTGVDNQNQSQEVDVVTNDDMKEYLTTALDCSSSTTALDCHQPQPMCLNSPLTFARGKKPRDCAWVAKKSRCDKGKLSSHCQSSCDDCDDCQDSKLKFYLVNEEPREKMKCKDAKDNQELCKNEDFARTCPNTCGVCE